mgnify:CR=1 FL=1
MKSLLFTLLDDYRVRAVLIGFEAYLVIFLLLHFLITGSIEALYFAITLILSGIAWKGAKQVMAWFAPVLSLRPSGAKDCHSFPGSGGASKTGMPSGHSTGAALMAVYSIDFIWNRSIVHSLEQKIAATVTVLVLSLLIMLSRIAYHCHTIPQVLAGGALGVALGFVSIAIRKSL